MELCTGGSLYEVIDSPENAFGLDETQFKQLIYDVGQFMWAVTLTSSAKPGPLHSHNGLMHAQKIYVHIQSVHLTCMYMYMYMYMILINEPHSLGCEQPYITQA